MGAMAALFAGCAEDYEVAQNGFDKVANRPSAGNVVLNTAISEEGGFDADTRVIWDNGFKFQENDRIGAFLYDEFNETNIGNTTIADYTFVDYNQTNYPFQTTDRGTTWKTPDNAALCEGNYFFTMRYESTYKNRAYVEFSLPNVQKNYNEETGEHDVNADYAKLQQRLGYAFIPATAEDVNEVNATFVPIFASPKFKIMNHTAQTLKVMKLIVRTHQHGPAGMPSKMPTTVVLAPNSKKFAEVQAEYPGMSNEGKILAMVDHAILVKDGFLAEEPASGSGIKVDSEKGTYEYVIDMGDNYMVKNGSNILGQLVMPAGNYENFDVYALIEVQDDNKTTGIISLTNLKNADWSDQDTQNGSMNVVLKPTVKPMPAQVMTATIDAGAIGNLGMKDFAVTNTEDLMFVLNLMAKEGGDHNITVKTLGNEVELTSEVYSILSDPKWSNNKLQIDGTIVIPASLESDNGIDILWTDDKVETTIINRGVQVLDENLVADVINEGSLTEAEDKDVTITGNVTNKGTLVVNKIEGDLTAEAGSAVVAVNESGEMTVAAGANVTITESAVNVTNDGYLTTKGVIYWNLVNNENATWTVNGDQELKGNGATNNGLMRVGQFKVTTVEDAKLINNGTIDNYGNINLVYRNYGVINNNLNEDGTEAEVTVNVNSTTGTINNWGTVNVQWGNQGRINMMQKEADVYFLYNLDSASEQSGSIENTVHGNIQNIPDVQHIIYTADGSVAMDDVVKAMKTYGKYTDLFIAGNYSLNTVDVSPSTVNATLKTITICEGVQVVINQNQNVKLGYSTKSYGNSVVNNGTIIIAHSASLNGAPITNNGLIRKHNSGKLNNEFAEEGEYVEFD